MRPSGAATRQCRAAGISSAHTPKHPGHPHPKTTQSPCLLGLQGAVVQGQPGLAADPGRPASCWWRRRPGGHRQPAAGWQRQPVGWQAAAATPPAPTAPPSLHTDVAACSCMHQVWRGGAAWCWASLSHLVRSACPAMQAGEEAEAGGTHHALVVAHNAVNQALIATALGLPPTYFRRLLQVWQRQAWACPAAPSRSPACQHSEL